MPAWLPVRTAITHRQNTGATRALTSATVRANTWIHNAGGIIQIVPESHLLGDRAIYVDGFLAAQTALSPEGLFPAKGAETALRALASVDERMGQANLDLNAAYTNDFGKSQREIPLTARRVRRCA